MMTAQLIRSMSRNDAKLIGRDRFLVFMMGFIVYIAVALRFGLPWLNGYLIDTGVMPGERIAQNLAYYYPLIIGYMIVFQGSIISGTIFGFALLDEKDDGTIKAMLVTPVPLNSYVLYRIGMPTLFAFFIVLLMVYGINLAMVPLGTWVLIAAGASLTAPIAALFYAIVAENKVQGFAISKFAGLIGWVVLIGWFVGEPWQWLFGLFPPFWICKAYWMALDGHALWWLALLAGIVTQLVAIVWLAKLFNRMAYR